MTNVKRIYDFLNEYCPFELAEEWDNPGLNLGHWDREVKKVLLALDLESRAIDTAREKGCNLILTHHPLTMEPLRQWNDGDPTAALVLKLAEAGIAHLACHTNLDACEGGVNTQLAAACGMEQTELFEGLGRMGTCKTTFDRLAADLKKALPAACAKGVCVRQEVERIAVVGGSGGSLLEGAAALGCDTFVTGEVKHHQALLARELGLNLLVLGHYETEYIALPPLAAALQKAFPELEVEIMPCEATLETF